jgi:diacylglycerol kinase (ATP)
VDRVVVCGGDGSVREAAQGLRDTGVALAVVPLGTANVLAQEMGLPHRNPRGCAAVAARGRPAPVGLGDVNGRDVFTFCASCGLDSIAVADLDAAMKDQTGAWAYAYSALHNVIASDAPALQVETEDGRRLRACQVFAARAGRYGGGRLFLTRRADLKAPHMRVLVVAPPLGPRLPGILIRLGTSDLEGAPGVTAFDARAVRITAETTTPVQADGDAVSATPAHLASQPDALVLVFPREVSP